MTEFTFDDSPWQEELDRLQPGACLSAARFLTLTEGETDEMLEEAFQAMEEKRIGLDISALPVIQASGDTAVRLRLEQQLVSQGDLETGLPEDDLLRLYLQEVAQTPSFGDGQVLAEAYLAGDQAAAEKLVSLQLGQVIQLAKATPVKACC